MNSRFSISNNVWVCFEEVCNEYGLHYEGTETGHFVWAEGGQLDGKHIHFEFEKTDAPLVFRMIRPKSGVMDRPELASENTDHWLGLVDGMSNATILTVKNFKRLIEEKGRGDNQ